MTYQKSKTMTSISNFKNFAIRVSHIMATTGKPHEVEAFIKSQNICFRNTDINTRRQFFNDLELSVSCNRQDLVEFVCQRDLRTGFALWNLRTPRQENSIAMGYTKTAI